MKILGFDLGDGESAVTLLDEDSTVEPRVMPLCGKNSLISAVGVKDGRIVIGEAASVTDGAAEAKVRFKSRYLTDPAASADVRAFAQGVMNELVRTQPALMAEVSRTVVGCPAGWGDGRREQYAALLESAGFPNVSVVPEPRAAFLYARHARGLRVSPELMKKSAMVIDVGSSTTDFAYIVDGRQQNVSLFGDTNLGGGLIDERILAHALAASKDGKAIRAVFAESSAWRSYCELEARRLKESYFLDEGKWADAPLTRTLTVCYDEPLALELSIGGASIRGMVEEPIAALGGRSFVGSLQDALRAAVEVSRACPPEVVILTGGASRMAFFQQACREAFANALVVLCPEPECSIARGLAYAGRVDERLSLFRREVASIAHGEKLSVAVNASAHELYEPVAKALFDIAQESTLEAVRLWRKGGVDTIEALNKKVERKISKAFAGDALCDRIGGELQAAGRADAHAGKRADDALRALRRAAGADEPDRGEGGRGAFRREALAGGRDGHGYPLRADGRGAGGRRREPVRGRRHGDGQRGAGRHGRGRGGGHTAGAGRQERHGKGAGQGEAAAAGAQVGDG